MQSRSGAVRGGVVPTSGETVETVNGAGASRDTPLKPNPCSWTRCSPHPDPLPKGEGERFGSRKQSHRPRNFEIGGRGLPLSEGEGWGERNAGTAWIGLKRGINGRSMGGIGLAFFLATMDSQGAQAPVLTNNPTVTTNLARPSALVPKTNLVSEFQIKRGFRLELVASSPMVCAPAAMAFDETGAVVCGGDAGLSG